MALALALVNLAATCRSPEGEGGQPAADEETPIVQLKGVDTSALTAREQGQWSALVTELLAPCPDQAVSIAQCIKESRPCELCLPAAKFLESQIRRGRARAQTEQAFRLRFSPDTVKQIDVSGSPEKGAAHAAVTLVEWADFECPFCGQAAPEINRLIEKYPEHVQLVFKHYPLSAHQHAEVAARAAVAAAKQGKFWQLHRALFENQEKGLSRETIEKLAAEAGLDMKRFRQDLESEAAADFVNRDRKQAEKLGLKGTPMIYVNGRHFDLELFSLHEDLENWIKLEIKQRTGKVVEAKPVPPASSPPPPGSAAPPPASAPPPPPSSKPAPPKGAP